VEEKIRIVLDGLRGEDSTLFPKAAIQISENGMKLRSAFRQ